MFVANVVWRACSARQNAKPVNLVSHARQLNELRGFSGFDDHGVVLALKANMTRPIAAVFGRADFDHVGLIGIRFWRGFKKYDIKFVGGWLTPNLDHVEKEIAGRTVAVATAKPTPRRSRWAARLGL
jgi:hypothetical protein